MAITYVAGATATGANGVATITYPAGIQVRDTMVMSISWKRGIGTYFYVPDGWTLWERVDGAGVAYQAMILTKEADGGESGNTLVVNDGATQQGIVVAMAVYRGCHVVPRSHGATIANSGGADTSVEWPDPGGSQAGDLRVAIAMARGSASGPSGSPSFSAVSAGFTIRQQVTETNAAAQNAATAIADGTGAGVGTFTATASTYSTGGTLWLRPAIAGAHSIFTTETPGSPNLNESSPYTLGTTWYPTVDGKVSAARWRFPNNLPTGGSVTAGLWVYTGTASGTLLATTTFSSPTAGAWNTANFASPVQVTAGSAYVIAIYTPNAYVATTGGFSSEGITNGYLVAPVTGADPVGLGALYNGRYHAGGGSLTFPETSFSGSSYFVDVVFTPDLPSTAAPNRLYLTSAAPEYTPATIRGSWTNSTTTAAWKLGKRPEGEATSSARADTVTTNPNKVLLGRWVSHGALRAGTIAGSMNWCMGVLESNAAMNAFFRFHVYVLAGDTDTIRGVLRTEIVNSTEWISSSPVGRTGNDWTLTSTAIQAGDRLVVEVGYSAQNSVSTSYTGTIYFGTQGSVDLSLADPNVAALPGWLEFTEGEGLWWEKSGDIADDFNDGTLDTTDRWADTWTDGGTTPAETGGRARIYCTTGFGGILTRPWTYFRDTEVSWQMVTLANGASGSSEVYFKGSVEAGVEGRYLGWYLNLKSGELRAHQAVDFWDDAATVLTWNATTHKWLRIREAAGTVYWETSTDGTSWTVRRSAPTPWWCSYKDSAVSFDAHRDAGTGDFFEIDNVNTGPPTGTNYNKTGADTADAADAATVAEVKPRTAGPDTAAGADAATARQTRTRTGADIAAAADAAGAVLGRTRTGSDTAAAGDSTTVARVLPRTGADTAGLGDTATVARAVPRAGADTAAAGDAATAALTRTRTGADTADLVDTAARTSVRVRGGADTAALDDTATRVTGQVRTAPDSAGLDDTATRVTVRVRAATDTVAVVDTGTAAQAKPRTAGPDTAGAVDTATITRSIPRVGADTAALGDGTTVARSAPRTGADAAALADAATAGQHRTRPDSDTAGVADSATAMVGRNRTSSDTAGLVDAATAGLTRTRTATDTADLVDAAVRARAATKTAGPDTVGTDDEAVPFLGSAKLAGPDPAAITDAATVAMVRTVAAADTVAAGDAATRTSVRVRDAGDTAGLDDTATARVGTFLPFGDTADLVDTASRASSRTRAGVDGAGAADTTTVVSVRGRQVADTAPAADTVSVAETKPRSVGDTAGITDGVVARIELHPGAADVGPVLDAATRQVARARAGSDGAALLDVVVAVLTRTRPVGDGAGVVDTATAVPGRNRTVSDGAGVADQVTLSLLATALAADTAALLDQVLVDLTRGGVGVVDQLPLVDTVTLTAVLAPPEPVQSVDVPVIPADTTVPVVVAAATVTAAAPGGVIVPVPSRRVTVTIS